MKIQVVRTEAQWHAYEFEQWRQAVLVRGLRVESLDPEQRAAVIGTLAEVVPTYNQIGLDYAA